MARQKKISRTEWKAFLSDIRAGQTVTVACEALSISRSSPYRKRERDCRFAEEWNSAERDSIELLSDYVVKAAIQPDVIEKYDGEGRLIERVIRPPNIYNAIRVLERRHPHWKPSTKVSTESNRTNIPSARLVDGQLILTSEPSNAN